MLLGSHKSGLSNWQWPLGFCPTNAPFTAFDAVVAGISELPGFCFLPPLLGVRQGDAVGGAWGALVGEAGERAGLFVLCTQQGEVAEWEIYAARRLACPCYTCSVGGLDLPMLHSDT